MFHVMLISQQQASIEALRNFKVDEASAGSDQALLRHFLVRIEYHLVSALARQGADFLTVSGSSGISSLVVLVKHGFTFMIEDVVAITEDLRLKRGD